MENDKLQLQNSNQLAILKQKPKDFLAAINPKSVSDIVLSQNPSIVIIKNEIGENQLKALLVILISDVVEFFSVGKTMNDSQIKTTVELIIEAYGQYKIDDWKLCFKKAMLGQYGVTYDRIDGTIIFDWFDKYLEERNEEFERARTKEAKNIELGLKQIDSVVEMPEALKQFAKSLGERKIKPVELNQTEQQKLISDTLIQFEKLWKNQGSKAGKQFVWIDGQAYDIQEYLEFKLIKHGKDS